MLLCNAYSVAFKSGQCTEQVAQLKSSRDKLLAELERQFLEVDRLSVENSALSQVCQCLTLLILPLFSGHK